jgi:hypothetical protein
MKVARGQESKLIEAIQKWEAERKPKVEGAVANLLLKSDRNPDEFIGVAVFRDKATYRANADDPEQDKWFQQMRLLLQSDVDWEDGEFVVGTMA